MYMGGSFSMLGETLVEDPEGKCSIDEFRLSCCFCGQLEIKDSCSDFVDLGQHTSPFQSTLMGRGDSFPLSCIEGRDGHDGPEQVFTIDVPPGMQLSIGLPDNREMQQPQNSLHEMRWGGNCPGDHALECHEFTPPGYFTEWTNTQTDEQRVYFVVGTQSQPGDFKLEWELTSETSQVFEFGSGTLVDIEVHIRTERRGSEATWNIDGASALTFGRGGGVLGVAGALEDTQGS